MDQTKVEKGAQIIYVFRKLKQPLKVKFRKHLLSNEIYKSVFQVIWLLWMGSESIHQVPFKMIFLFQLYFYNSFHKWQETIFHKQFIFLHVLQMKALTVYDTVLSQRALGNRDQVSQRADLFAVQENIVTPSGAIAGHVCLQPIVKD